MSGLPEPCQTTKIECLCLALVRLCVWLFKCSKTKLKKNYVFKKKLYMIFPKSFFFQKKLFFKINICIPLQKI